MGKTNSTGASALSNETTFSFPSSGKLDFPMTNDYLFRALLQKNNRVLKGLIGSLLHMNVDSIVSAIIQNPIELGKSFDDKTFILDVKVLLNNRKFIDLEMQVINYYDWPERSLSYLCRNFDNLSRGDEYINVKSVHQIGILDYTLFEEYPEFYATYGILNIRNHHVYSSKLRLSVLDLTHIDMATDEDKTYKIDYWARLFKSSTWEDLNMLAQSDVIIKDAAETVYEISQDKLIREQMEAREANIRSEKSLRKHYEDEIGELHSSLKNMVKHYEDEIGELNAAQKNIVKHYEDEIGELNAAQKNIVKHYEDIIADQQKQIEELKAALPNK
jgi:predicted transposase/invertase (TIGR01784 family)